MGVFLTQAVQHLVHLELDQPQILRVSHSLLEIILLSYHLRVDHSQLVHVDHTSGRFWLHRPQVGIVYRQLLAVLKNTNSRSSKSFCVLVKTSNQLPEVP